VFRMISNLAIAFALAGLPTGLTVMYAQTAPAAAPGTTPSQGCSGDVDTVVVLLDRIERVVSEARGDVDTGTLVPVGTTGTKEAASARVTIDAAALDEIRAEVAQIKSLLRKAPAP
jgi:hypothetical protein